LIIQQIILYAPSHNRLSATRQGQVERDKVKKAAAEKPILKTGLAKPGEKNCYTQTTSLQISPAR
jgi:hypothetical protein